VRVYQFRHFGLTVKDVLDNSRDRRRRSVARPAAVILARLRAYCGAGDCAGADGCGAGA
jgi:hypothetical protein